MTREGRLEGAGFRPGISDGFNPFGFSDHYISVYEGYSALSRRGNTRFARSATTAVGR